MKKKIIKNILISSFMMGAPLAMFVACAPSTTTSETANASQKSSEVSALSYKYPENIYDFNDNLTDAARYLNYHDYNGIAKRVAAKKIDAKTIVTYFLGEYLDEQTKLSSERKELKIAEDAKNHQLNTFHSIVEKLNNIKKPFLESLSKVNKLIFSNDDSGIENFYKKTLDSQFHLLMSQNAFAQNKKDDAAIQDLFKQAKKEMNDKYKIAKDKVQALKDAITNDFNNELKEVKNLVNSLTIPNEAESEEFYITALRFIRDEFKTPIFFVKAGANAGESTLKNIKDRAEELIKFFQSEDPAQKLLDERKHSHNPDPEHESHASMDREFLRIIRDAEQLNLDKTIEYFDILSNLPSYNEEETLTELRPLYKVIEFVFETAKEKELAGYNSDIYKQILDFLEKNKEDLTEFFNTLVKLNDLIFAEEYTSTGYKTHWYKFINNVEYIQWLDKFENRLNKSPQAQNKQTVLLNYIKQGKEQANINLNQEMIQIKNLLPEAIDLVNDNFKAKYQKIKSELDKIKVTAASPDSLLLVFNKFKTNLLKGNLYNSALEAKAEMEKLLDYINKTSINSVFFNAVIDPKNQRILNDLFYINEATLYFVLDNLKIDIPYDENAKHDPFYNHDWDTNKIVPSNQTDKKSEERPFETGSHPHH
ncbi:hypothetical protein NV226_00125 [Mycoplasma iguanae]|uniref:Lipoprotein n=1 Tax=Mycoplasma iguanae TaxID=292461 RepID=A0ABY5R8S8_9MOLU|nr:hypothetical protein [Mycoplasma iguanae]UVD81716.1 hypothetical protein NV226_00125 [Mycoplasma iguanae]